jgi:formylglycine-generating enzyme required for sulfatase activity
LIVYNVLGQNIRTLVNGYLSSGSHTAVWNGRDDNGVGIGAGVYIYRLTFGKESLTGKMLLLDGNNTRVSTFSQDNASSGEQRMKPTADTFKVDITGTDIEPFSKTGLSLTDGNTYEFTVFLKKYYPQEMKFVSVTGGTFLMGFTAVAEPIHSVSLGSYQISDTEITNAQYCAFLNAMITSKNVDVLNNNVYDSKGTYNRENFIQLSLTYSWIQYGEIYSGSSHYAGFIVPPDYRNLPAIGVTWFGAKAFADYYGWDLPREAEWEYACGGAKQYQYGTDDGTINKSKANYSWGSGNPAKPVNVKSFPPNPLGLYDMSGNVWEWCGDWYGPYSSSSVTNPTGPLTGSGGNRVNKGGSWNVSGFTCQSATHGSGYGSQSNNQQGFRVARR